jgi:hypothetical protein
MRGRIKIHLEAILFQGMNWVKVTQDMDYNGGLL